MLNFLVNVFNEKSGARTTCGSNDADVIQSCAGCDSECQYTCYVMCSNSCYDSEQESSVGGGTCNNQCTGSCFSAASIMGGK